jgi:rod shape-determining protein MreC
VVIDKGSVDGVMEGMPVVVAEGVVGRVIRSAPHDSRVLLLTDASSAVASLVQRNRTRGVVRGQGDILTLDFALRQKDIEVGDRIVTSGTGGVFPKGLVIGEVTRTAREQYGLFQTVTVSSAVDFARLEEVLVLVKENP